MAEKKFNKRAVGSFYLPLHNKYDKMEVNPYAMKGFYLNLEEVVKALDNRLSLKSTSDIVNAGINLDGTVKKSEKALEDKEFSILKNYAQEVSSLACNEILDGYIAPKPIDADSACKYCPYSHICNVETKDLLKRKSETKKMEDFGGQDG